MPMPTTRRGRFLFYRDRAQRRLRRVERRYGQLPHGLLSGSNHAGGRAFDLSGYTKQVPLTDYTSRARTVHPPHAFMFAFFITPSRGVWGVLFSPPPYGFFPYKSHRRTAYSHYFERRVKSIPRLRHLPKKPYLGPYNPAFAGEYFPFQFYPSGRPNPHWVGP